MEYNLIKTIETNYGYVGNEDFVITPFPSELIEISGIGQIVNSASIIIPLHNSHDLTRITKKTEFELEDQSGGGNEDNTESTNEEERNSKITYEQSSDQTPEDKSK